MIENRRFYRLPSHARFVFGNEGKVFTGKSTNLSSGGAFVQLLDIRGLQTGDRLKCDLMLHENAPVLGGIVQIRRVSPGSPNPNDFRGIGVEFVDYVGDAKRLLEEYIFEQKRLYELLGTLLQNTEPDLRSMKPLLAKLPSPRPTELRDLRVFVESTLHAIQMVEEKG